MFLLTESEKQYQFDFEMAELDLEAERYTDAENKLSHIARQISSPNAYLGIAISKSGRYLEGGTTENEILFCFKKARDIAENKEEISQLAAKLSLSLIEALFKKVIDNVFGAKQAEADERKAKIASMVSAAVVGASKPGSTGKIAGLTIGGTSIMSAVANRQNQIASKITALDYLLRVGELQEKTEEFLEEYPSIKEEFISVYSKMKEQTHDAIMTDDQKFRKKKYESEKARILALPNDSPFYSYREEALANFDKKEYISSLEKIKLALEIFPEDVEMTNLRQHCFNKARSADKTIFWVILVVGLLLIGFYGGELEKTSQSLPSWVGWLAIAYPIAGTLYNENRHKNRVQKYWSI